MEKIGRQWKYISPAPAIFCASALGFSFPVGLLFGFFGYYYFAAPLTLLLGVGISFLWTRFVERKVRVWGVLLLIVIFSGYAYAFWREKKEVSSYRLPSAGDFVQIKISSAYPSGGGRNTVSGNFSGEHKGLFRGAVVYSVVSPREGEVWTGKWGEECCSLEGAEKSSSPQGALIKIRDLVSNNIRLHISEPQASLLTGSIIGRLDNFDKDLKNKMIKTGTIHLVAVSGFNIAIAVSYISHIAQKLGKIPASSLGLICGWLIVLVSGASAPAVRAGIMATASLLGGFWGRGASGALPALIWSAALMCLHNPAAITDVGFQLSFASVLGLILLELPIRKKLEERLGKKISALIATPLAAQIGATPVSLLVFGQVSITSLPANILVSPLAPAVMALSALTAFLAKMSPFGQLAAFAAWAVSKAQIGLISFWAVFPSMEIKSFTSRLVLAFFIIILAILIFKQNKNEEGI